MIRFHWRSFSELSVTELYDFLKLRSDVFVVEQQCVFLDLDGKDAFAHHLLGIEKDEVVAYLRLFPPTEAENYLVFGRLVTSRKVRSKGYGKALMTELMTYCEKHFPGMMIQCSAQQHLKKFYENFGLIAYGDVYMEDGISHIGMKKNI